MITWNIFIWFGVTAIILATAGATAALCANDHWAACSVKYRQRRTIAVSLTVAAVAVMTAFIIGLWSTLQRPPLRTMGETRLWYSFFALISGLLTYLRWRYKWILSYSTVLAAVFIIINIAKPQIHDQSLMPALQSVWFIPHVTVYMFSYSLLGCAFLLFLQGPRRNSSSIDD